MFMLFTRPAGEPARKTIADIKPPRVIFSNVDWTKMRPVSGAAATDKLVGERLRGDQ